MPEAGREQRRDGGNCSTAPDGHVAWIGRSTHSVAFCLSLSGADGLRASKLKHAV